VDSSCDCGQSLIDHLESRNTLFLFFFCKSSLRPSPAKTPSSTLSHPIPLIMLLVEIQADVSAFFSRSSERLGCLVRSCRTSFMLTDVLTRSFPAVSTIHVIFRCPVVGFGLGDAFEVRCADVGCQVRSCRPSFIFVF
jgi:hypothetical protein